MTAVGPPYTPEDPLFQLCSYNVALIVGTLVAPATITGVTLSAGVYTVTATAHGLSTGQIVTIAGVVFTGSAPGPNASGLVVTKLTANTFTVSIAGAGTFTYTSGGTATNTIADTQASALFTCGMFRQVTVGNTGGSLYLQGVGDAAPVLFQVAANQVLFGKFLAVGGPTTGTTQGMVLTLSL